MKRVLVCLGVAGAVLGVVGPPAPAMAVPNAHRTGDADATGPRLVEAAAILPSREREHPAPAGTPVAAAEVDLSTLVLLSGGLAGLASLLVIGRRRELTPNAHGSDFGRTPPSAHPDQERRRPA